MSKIINQFKDIVSDVNDMDLAEKVKYINELRTMLHDISPFKSEPVDYVEWVCVDSVKANDYNPNSVAPPEMELLRLSINNDGYTQPVVTWDNKDGREVVDGFHRTRVCKELSDVKARVHGYLPVVTIKNENTSKNQRMASTIRHNRARGKHNVTAMSDIVMELKNRNWKNSRIAKELGMDEDEVLRLCQITGLEDLFKDGDFTKSWEIGSKDDEFQNITDDFDDEEVGECRTVNTSDPDRVFHTYEKWECNKAGFYNTKVVGMTKTECEEQYYTVLTNDIMFSGALDYITKNWKFSCEHYLTNKAMNRIAWLGQAAVCNISGVPAKFCTGWKLLSDEEQENANQIALKYLNIWLTSHKMAEVTMKEAISEGRQVSIY